MPDILDQIGEELADSMPDVQEHAIQEHEAQERKNDATLVADSATPAAASNEVATSPNGQEYNPKTHMVSPQTGKIIKKRSSGSKKSVVGVSPKATAAKQEQESAQAAAQARATGQFAAGATVALCVGIFGDEFQPVRNKEKDEFAYLENAYADYFTATGRTDLPPVMGLCVAIGMYALPRFTMPKTQSRLGAMKDWVVSKFLAWRGRRQLKAAQKTVQE